MERASTFTIIKALLGLYLRVLRNALFLRNSRVGYKNAVPPRKVKKPWVLLILIPIIFWQAFSFSGKVVSALELDSYRAMHSNQWLVDASAIKVAVEGAQKESGEFEVVGSGQSDRNEYFSEPYSANQIRDEYGLPNISYKELHQHYDQFGEDGFFVLESITPSEAGTLAPFGVMVVKFCTLVWVALLTFALGQRLMSVKQNLGKDDVFAYLPIAGWQGLVGGYTSMTLLRIMVWFVVFPLVSHVWHGQGYSFGLALLMSLPCTLLFSAIVSSVELLIDTWLRYIASKKVVNRLQWTVSIASVVSIYLLYAIFLNTSLLRGLMKYLSFLDTLEPLVSLVLNTSYPYLCVLGLLFCAAAVSGVLACWVSGRIVNGGISHSLQEQGKRKKEVDPGEKKLWRFEVLALLRNRAIAAQIITVPFVMVVFQFFINPSFSEKLEFINFCLIGYGCGAYASLLAANSLFVIEQKGLWIVQSLPQEVSEYFGRRERIWRMLGSLIGVLVILSGFIVVGISGLNDLILAALSIVMLWVAGRVVNGIVLGTPKVELKDDGNSSFTPNPKRMYGAMLVAGIGGGLIYQQNIWGLIIGVFILWLLGQAIWDRHKVAFQYMLDPTENPPKYWGVDSVLWIILFFFCFQIVGVFLFMWVGNPILTLLLSFAFSGICCLGIIVKMNRKMDLPLVIPFSNRQSFVVSIVHSTGLAVACLGVAVVWLLGMKWLNVLSVDELSVDLQIELIILAVIAAPLIEEPIFRGKLFSVMYNRWDYKKAILLSSFLFAVVHPAVSFLPVFCLGAASAWIYYKSGALRYAILTHAIYNLGAIGLHAWL